MTEQNAEKLQALLEQCLAVFEEEKVLQDAAKAEVLSACGLEVHFIDVGQGDATLIKCGDAALLIDAGNNTKGTKVRKYLLDHGVTALNYAVGTHPGADHIGGLDSVLYNIPCERVFLSDKVPAESMTTQSYQDVLSALSAKNIVPEMPQLNVSYPLGEAKFTVISPAVSFPDSNDGSLVIRLTYGDTAFLFTGDATENAEAVMLASGQKLQSDVLKIGHHGSAEATSEAFLEAVSPSAAIISCGEDNSYGHPTEEVLQRLNKKGIQIYRTDLNGHIAAGSDSGKIIWKTEKEGNTEQQAESKPAEDEESNYILNLNRKTFHQSNCYFLKRTYDINRKIVDWTKEECIDSGYKPCRHCIV